MNIWKLLLLVQVLHLWAKKEFLIFLLTLLKYILDYLENFKHQILDLIENSSEMESITIDSLYLSNRY